MAYLTELECAELLDLGLEIVRDGLAGNEAVQEKGLGCLRMLAREHAGVKLLLQQVTEGEPPIAAVCLSALEQAATASAYGGRFAAVGWLYASLLLADDAAAVRAAQRVIGLLHSRVPSSNDRARAAEILGLPMLLQALQHPTAAVAAAAAALVRKTGMCQALTAADWADAGLDWVQPVLDRLNPALTRAVSLLLQAAWRAHTNAAAPAELLELSLDTIFLLPDINSSSGPSALMSRILWPAENEDFIYYTDMLVKCAAHPSDSVANVAAWALLQASSSQAGKAALQQHIPALVTAIKVSQEDSGAVKQLWQVLGRLNKAAVAQHMAEQLRQLHRLSREQQLVHGTEQETVEMAGAEQRGCRQQQQQLEGEGGHVRAKRVRLNEVTGSNLGCSGF